MTGARLGALVALAVLTASLVGLLVATTPWQPFPGPVPGGRVAADAHRDFSQAEIDRADRYHRAVRPPAYASYVLGLVVAGTLGLTTLGARLVTAAARPLGGSWPVTAAVGALAVLLVGRLVALPFDAWAESAQRRYGISTQSWATWAVDQLKGLGIGAAVVLVGLLLFFGLARLAPRTWWLWGALAAAALTVFGSFVYPVLVEPAFNKFTPLAAGELRTSLLELAQRDGLPVRDVLVADASRRTTAVNAYVSGFGSTRRIVVYDTLLERASPEQVRLVIAHELGHVKHSDVLRGTLIGALGAAAAVAGLYLLLTSAGVLTRIGASAATDPRALAFVLSVFALGAALVGPVEALVSRRIEARADVHSLDLTRDPSTFVATERRIAVADLADLKPDPIVYALFFSHPSSPERIALARDWARQHGAPDPLPLNPEPSPASVP